MEKGKAKRKGKDGRLRKSKIKPKNNKNKKQKKQQKKKQNNINNNKVADTP